MNIHIGQLIKSEMERQGFTPSWLAKKIFCDRTNVHKIYKKESIDIEMLYHISQALGHNFFHDLSTQYSLEIKQEMNRARSNEKTIQDNEQEISV